MYRILNAEKDCYIQNKVIGSSRSLDGNVGQAGTLDLFKLYKKSAITMNSDNPFEISRGLIKFDFSPIQSLTSSIFNTSGSNFKCYLKLRDVYGGQTTPHNFTLVVHPLAKNFDEGRGSDIISFKDIDSANWITSSIVDGTVVTWSMTGAYSSGNLGDTTVDYWISGNIGIGSQSLGVSYTFSKGDEDLEIDITSLFSASLYGLIPNYGYRIAYSLPEETDTTTRFVKRFATRHTLNKSLHPKLILKWDGDVISDDSNMAVFDQTNRFYVFNKIRGLQTNFVSNSANITGSNCLLVELVTSKSIEFLTTSYSTTHQADVTYTTKSLQYYSTYFTGSQLSYGTLLQTGSYYVDVNLNTFTNTELNSFLSGVNYTQTFQLLWKSLDRNVLYSSGSFIKFNKYFAQDTSFDERNYVVNMLNLKDIYVSSDKTRLRVFIQDYNLEQYALRLPKPRKSRIFKNMYWRLIDSYSKEEIVPFDTIGTKLSSDGDGMFFDFWFEDLDENKVYEFEFKIVEDDYVELINNQGFRFKVIP